MNLVWEEGVVQGRWGFHNLRRCLLQSKVYVKKENIRILGYSRVSEIINLVWEEGGVQGDWVSQTLRRCLLQCKVYF